MFTEKQLKKIKEEQINSRYDYLGILTEYQTIRKSLVQSIIYNELNQQQHFLFKRVLHGLNMYTVKEKDSMHWDKKRRIKKVWRRAQSVINTWKQTICNKRSNEIFQIFNSSKLAKSIVSVPVDETDKKFINTMSLKTLGIRYEDLIVKFMSEGLLPKNYFKLEK